jgi:hypothetical protein
MRFLRSGCRFLPLALVLITLGCSDLPTANDPSPLRSTAGFFDEAPAPGFGALEWAQPVAHSIQVRQEIGPAGGVIRLGSSGVEIHFPEGAVSEAAMIEAEVMAGSVVVITFGGNGLTFNVPVEIRIEIDRLTGSWNEGDSEEGLLGVSFSGDTTSGVTPVGTVPVYVKDGVIILEIMDVPSGRNDGFRDFPIHRFIGYAVASG